MKIIKKNKPRKFIVGIKKNVTIKDCAKIFLNKNEQITFIGKNNLEYDVARKDWAFYATPSMNGRLKKFGLKSSLVRNKTSNMFFVLLVEKNKKKEFYKYLKKENCEIITWLDSDKMLNKIKKNAK